MSEQTLDERMDTLRRALDGEPVEVPKVEIPKQPTCNGHVNDLREPHGTNR